MKHHGPTNTTTTAMASFFHSLIIIIFSIQLKLNDNVFTTITVSALPNVSDMRSFANNRAKVIIPKNMFHRQYPRKKQKVSRKYEYLNSKEIRDALLELAIEYPDLTTLQTAQDTYDLPTAGGKTDCPFDHNNNDTSTSTNFNNADRHFRRRLQFLHDRYISHNKTGFSRLLSSSSLSTGCINWILTIEDSLAHPTGFPSAKYLPEVFLGGAIHGDERVGPTVTIETARLLLEAAHCESLPHSNEPGPNDGENAWEEWGAQLEDGTMCRSALSDSGFMEEDRQWFARLVTTRRIVIVPLINALGYYRVESGEDGIDPTIDFPFDLRDDTCMRTIAARVMNEVFQDHVFQLGMMFHTGKKAIAFEWGARSYKQENSPDHEVFKEISKGYATIGGQFKKRLHWKDKEYKIKPLHKLLGSTGGLLEDWAYAGSWDKDHTAICRPTTYGGYPESKMTYSNATLRVFTSFVGATENKHVEEDHLGTNKYLLDPTSKWNGYIPRNIRLSLMMIDIVEPYVTITKFDKSRLADDIVPLRRRKDRACMTSKAYNIPRGNNWFFVDWTIGGGFSVDQTGVLYVKWSDLPYYFDEETQPTATAYDDLVAVINGSSNDKIRKGPSEYDSRRVHGRTRWHEDGAYPKDRTSSSHNPTFFDAIDTSMFAEGDTIAVLAYAKLDGHWGLSSPNAQTHIVNARTNPNWDHSYQGKAVQGRLYWFSLPLTLVVKPPTTPVTEASVRLPRSEKQTMNVMQQLMYEYEKYPNEVAIIVTLTLFVTICISGLICCMMYDKICLTCGMCKYICCDAICDVIRRVCCFCCTKFENKKLYTSILQNESNFDISVDSDDDEDSDDDGDDGLSDVGIVLEQIDTSVDTEFATKKKPRVTQL